MYQLLLRFIPPRHANCIMALWYWAVILHIIYYSVVEQANFPYAGF